MRENIMTKINIVNIRVTCARVAATILSALSLYQFASFYPLFFQDHGTGTSSWMSSQYEGSRWMIESAFVGKYDPDDR